jgi:hypothetical protein
MQHTVFEAIILSIYSYYMIEARCFVCVVITNFYFSFIFSVTHACANFYFSQKHVVPNKFLFQ